ncbi:hypothetical protein [Streptomyces sp. NPDC012616]|uniref:hypothetical protein n=1 Tax=Streptomyces sp. NPDC012616 TaxID=3364840 RepID=UPI0036E37BCC
MPSPSWPYGLVPAAPDEINDLIRSLMDQPADGRRSAAYAALLVQWAEVSQADVEPAA